MIAGVLRLMALLVAGCVMISAAAAQSDPRVCAGLAAQLQRLDRAATSPEAQRYQAALAQQQGQLNRALEMADQMRCHGGFIFGPAPAPQCPELMDRIAAMQQNERALAARMRQFQGGDPRVEAQRQNVLAALAQNGCGGGQYAAAASAPARPRGLFDLLFGNHEEESAPAPNGPITLPEENVPRASTYRTVCVRKADGFFYPISFATTRNNFERDAAICQRTCPGTPAEMFAYPNPGGSMKDAVAIDGQHYTDLPNAFLYKKKFVPGVSCKPDGETWVQALTSGQNVNATTANNRSNGSGNGVIADDPASASRPTYDASGPPGSIGHAPAGLTGGAVAAGPPSGHSGVIINGREPPATITTPPLDPLH